MSDDKQSHVESRTLSCSSVSTLSSSDDSPDSTRTDTIAVPFTVSVTPQNGPSRRSSMSARTLEESLRGDAYLKAARRRRTVRRTSSIVSAPLDEDIEPTRGVLDREELSVSFSSVEIREFPIQMGDNPSVSSGPPLTIGWEHSSENNFDINAYESNLPPKRNHAELLVPYKERWRRLKEVASLTDDQIFEETKKVNTSRYNRAETIVKLEGAYMEEKMESARRWVRGVTKRKKKQQEKKMIQAGLEQDRRERERRLSAVDIYQ